MTSFFFLIISSLNNKFKVVDNNAPLQSLARESQPLPAYQYFENLRNFLVAAEELKLPAFEASDLERVYHYPHYNLMCI